MSLLLNLATAAYTLIAVALLVLGLTGWMRSRRPKTAILALAFAWFAAAGVFASWWIFTREDLVPLLATFVTLNALGLLTIYFASVKR